MKAALEPIGKNISVRAFLNKIEVNHSSKLEEMLNARGNELEESAKARPKLVSCPTHE